MGEETKLRHRLQDNLSPYGHVCAIENAAGVGNPDTNYCILGRDGWIELKHRHELPKRSSTPALGQCLRPAQRIWFNEHLKAGSRHCWFMARIDDEMILIAGGNMAHFETCNIEELRSLSFWVGVVRRKPDWHKLAHVLEEGW